MKRTFNYTGRQKINRDRIYLQLDPEPGDEWRFTAQLDLEGLETSPTDRVFIDVYGTYAATEIDCGTVGDLKLPSRRRVTSIPNEGHRLGQVRVVDVNGTVGRIVAAATQVPIVEPDSPTDSLLPIQAQDIAPETWQLQLAPRPVLKYDRSIAEHDLKHHVTGGLFRGLVYPAVVRMIIQELQRKIEGGDLDPEETPEDGTDERIWWEWKVVAEAHAGRPVPDETDDLDWTEFTTAVVQRFSKDLNALGCFLDAAQTLED